MTQPSFHEHLLLSKLSHWMDGGQALFDVMTSEERGEVKDLIRRLAAESAPPEPMSTT